MSTNERISRERRLKKFGRRKAGIALALAIALLLLVIGKTYRSQFANLLNESFVGDMFRKHYSGSLDSLALQFGRQYLLNNPPEIAAAPSDTSGVAVKRIRQPWPRALPLLFYSRDLQRVCDENGIGYSSTTYGPDDSLVCELRASNDSGLEVAVIPDRKTRLDKRSLGIIFKNIYELDNRDIIKMVDSEIPFGYLATVDVYPAGEIKRRLRSRQVASIVTIEASQKGLSGKGAAGDNADSKYKKYASGLLDLHPNPAFIDVERTNNIDKPFITALMDEAKKRDIGYIYKNRVPDGVDSVAYAAGLSFISFDNISDYTARDWGEIKGLLTADLILANKPAKEIIIADISRIRVDDLTGFVKYLKRLGIKILYINKLSDESEFRITDL